MTTRTTEPCAHPTCDRHALDDSAWCLLHTQHEQQRRAREEQLTAETMTTPIRTTGLYEPTPRPREEAERLSAAARQAITHARLRKAQVPDRSREAS